MANVLFSAMRNEGPFLLDWIAYHRAIGFENIFIVTNDCTDGSESLLQKLDKAGIVVHIIQDVSPELGPQRSAVAIAEREGFLDEGDWGMFLDADEYLNIHIGDGRVQDLVTYLSVKGKSGMLVNWRIFGAAGNQFFPGSYISESFTRCEVEPLEASFKTFFQKNALVSGFSARGHRCRLKPNVATVQDFVAGSGANVGSADNRRSRRRHALWVQAGESGYAKAAGNEVGFAIAQVNHYAVRDRCSFALKRLRGRGSIAANEVEKTGPRHTDKYYRLYNRNEAEDRTILRWSDKTDAIRNEIITAANCTKELEAITHHYHEAIASVKAEVIQTDAERFPLTMPAKEQEFLRDVYAQAEQIMEFGSGGSTVLAAEIGKPCVSIESDANWAFDLNGYLESAFGHDVTARALHVDIGKTKSWGYPVDASRWTEYWRYPLEVWQNPELGQPDVVLIDGRMRMACFAGVVMNVQRDTLVLFDDYIDRPNYHVIETLVKRDQTIGRMAVFKVKPKLIQEKDFLFILPWFFDLS